MKKAMQWLIAVTLVFAALTVGFFLGRNVNFGEIRLSSVSQDSQIIPTTQAPTQATEPTTQESQQVTQPASLEQLQALEGIGPVLAQRIIDYRTEHGPFASIADLANVNGIGDKRLDTIWDDITV